METGLSAFLVSSDPQSLSVSNQAHNQHGIRTMTCTSSSQGVKLLEQKRVQGLNENTMFWRNARCLYSIYAQANRIFELGAAPCPELENPVDAFEPQAMNSVRQWLDELDARLHIWQLRQLLQSTNLQNEETLRVLIMRHQAKPAKTLEDRDKVDFLLVQYFAHCAPDGLAQEQVTLDQVAEVLEPVLGVKPAEYPEWSESLDGRLRTLRELSGLSDLQESQVLVDARNQKNDLGDQYFEPAIQVVFARSNFLARAAFFRALHLDLRAIRTAVDELERMERSMIDCREAGLGENESLGQIRHLIDQWKTLFRAPYSGGNSFETLIALRRLLIRAVDEGGKTSIKAPTLPELESCIAEIRTQLLAQPPKNTPSVSAISVGGCKLLVASWEAEAFTRDQSEADKALQQAVATQAILRLHLLKYRKSETMSLAFAVEIARQRIEHMRNQMITANGTNDIDVAVNLSATTKRLVALVEECEKLCA
jgi:hypothetical protein